MSAFNVSPDASEEDWRDDDGRTNNNNKAEVLTVDSCVEPDKILEDLVINNNGVNGPIKFQSRERRRKGYYPPRRFESWHGMTKEDYREQSESEKESDTNNICKLQAKSDRTNAQEKASDVENRQTLEADSVKEEIPNYELAINSFEERFFGKTQTFDIENQLSSVVPLGVIGVNETRNLFADTRPLGLNSLLLQKMHHQGQPSEAKLLIPDADYETEETPVNEYDGNKFEELFETNFKKTYQTALGIPESIDPSKVELTTYELEKFEKNYMIIFNHENFLSERKRRGTALDVAALKNTFKQFRFDVTIHDDLTEKDLFLEIRKFTRMDFRAIGCICVAILTNGQDHGYLRAFDTRYCERDVIACFDARLNPSLVGKPIIFLIQACRGRHPASVVDAQSRGSLPIQTVELDAVYPTDRHRRPMDSDIIMFHSSFFGRASIRVVEEGTWFIQTLCEQIRLHGATDHIEKLFRRVRTIVAHMEYEGAKQMPVVTSTLIKKLYLKKTISSSDLDEIWREALTKTLALMPRHKRKLFHSIRTTPRKSVMKFYSVP